MVLVSILGDFHSSILPIFFEFKKKITHHIILHDDSNHDKKHIKKLMKAQRKFLETYEEDGKAILDYKIDMIQVAEDSYEDILSIFKVIKTTAKEPKEIYLNATDGLSSISIVLSNKVLQCGGNVLAYDRYSNKYNIHTGNFMKKKKIKNNMDIKSHLQLKGYELKSWTNSFTLKKRKDNILKLCKNLPELKEFATKAQEKKINDISGYNKYKKILHKIDKINNVPFLQGTIFEEYIYHIIVDNCDFDEVMIGLIIEFEKDFINELDIVMIKDNHLHTIECKFVNTLKGEQYVYKTNSIIDYLDDDGKAMILSIGGDEEKITRNGKKVQFTIGDKARAKNGNIKIHQSKIFNEVKFLNEINSFFNLGAK